MIELRTRKREMSGDGGNHLDKLGLRESCLQVSLRSPIWHVRAPMLCVCTLILGLPNPIRQVVPLIPHILADPPNHSHISPSSLCLVLSSTINAEYKVKWYLFISPCHDHELTLCTGIHRVQHTGKIDCFPFILTITRRPLDVAWPSGMPPYKIDLHHPAVHGSSKVEWPRHIPTVAS